MKYRYFEIMELQRKVHEMLKEDDIEAALLEIFSFLEANQPYIQSRIPQVMAIGISASVARLKKAFRNGMIPWEQINQFRSVLVKECLRVLEYLERDIEEAGYEKRSIGNFPHLFVVEQSLKRIESLFFTKV
jgi:hypothetical protein